LIELLVVVAIIALLLAILLPSLAGARKTGQSGVCLANLRRLGVAHELYIQAYDTPPPFRLKQFPADGPTYVNSYGAAEPRWQWFVDHGVGPVIDPMGFTLPFNDNSMSEFGRDGMTMTNSYFVDPALNGESAFNIRNGAYGFNYQYLGNSRTDTDPDAFDNWPVGVTKLSAPSRTVLIGDSRGGSLGHGKHSYALDPPRLAVSRNATHFGPNGSSPGEELGHSPVEARHHRKGNVVFLDSHAETMTLNALGYGLDSQGDPVPEGPGASNALWTGDGRDEP